MHIAESVQLWSTDRNQHNSNHLTKYCIYNDVKCESEKGKENRKTICIIIFTCVSIQRAQKPKKKKRNSISIFLLSTKCIFFFTLVQSYHLPQINWPDAIKKNVNPIIFNDNVLFALAIYKRFILKIVFFCISN